MTRSPLPVVVLDGVIDVSHHNGAIDWSAVAGAGIALAFVKATQGTRFVDPTFERNRPGAAKASVLVMPYHFIDGADPQAQAEHFIAVAGIHGPVDRSVCVGTRAELLAWHAPDTLPD